MNMAGELEIIDRVIAEHQIIRLNIQGVRNSMADYDALFSLQKAQSGWAQTSIEQMTDRKRQLQEALNLVQKGLNNHFLFEETGPGAIVRGSLHESAHIRTQRDKTATWANNINGE